MNHFNMGRKDKDSQSASSSSASKMSLERGRNPKPPRFSLRRFFCRRPSTRSLRSMKAYNEPETRSMGSFHAPPHDRDRESPNTTSHISVEEVSHQSTSSVQTSHGKKSKDSIECPLCLQYQPKDSFPVIMTCHHRSCRDCLKQYLKIEITESRINIACPECSERFHPNDIKAILENNSLMNKYEEFMLRRVLVLDPDTRWCPAPDCGYAVIAAGCASCPKLKCERPGCDSFFCYHCKQHWHPNQTCDAARAERSSNLRSSSVSNSHESGSNSDIKPCPRCGAFIVKMDDGSCNHMTCAVCGAEFCWLCMKEISDLHYLSPSGCTFWGKKPWSRKKKILWQLGTLVGAPVGIALVAGIAVPAMIIGIPVWVGKKLYAKYEHAPKHKRNLIIVGGVSASVVIAPVIAGLAVGIGVPILLAYVYGVVPISLCRSGGCGVTTNSGGVRFEFDDDNDVTVGVSGPYSGGDVQSVEQAPHINNPSIGPSIGEMSLGMTNSLSASGSHIERIGIVHESDRESASHKAMAGTSLTGSLSGSTGFHTRVEIQADVSQSAMSSKEKRASLSSESANLSLDAKSATISFGDNASTKALAGSICTKDRDNNSAVIPPFEVTQAEQSITTSLTTTAIAQQSSTTLTAMAPTAVHSTPTCNGTGTNGGSEVISKSRHGSPTSSRSVSFLCDEVGDRSASVKKKKFKLQSVSVGDSIHEHSESSNNSHMEDCMSVRSWNTDSKSNVDLAPPPPSTTSSSANGSRAVSPMSEPDVHKKNSDHPVNNAIGRVRSTSTDSVTSKHSGFNGPNGLPEVEVDRLGNLMEKGLVSKVGVSNSSEGGLSSVTINKNNNSGSFVGVGAKPKSSFFGLTGSTSSSCVTNHRPVNQIDSCPALMCDPIAIDQSVESIYNKSISLRTIPDPPPLTRSKVTIDGQKRVTYQRSPDSSDSMLNSPNLSETRSSSGSASDTSTCGLLKRGNETQKSESKHDQHSAKTMFV